MPCNASYARFIFGKFFTRTIILYVLLFAQKVLFLQKVGVTYMRDDTLLKVSTIDPWYANIVNYIVAGYIPQGPIRRLSEIVDYTFAMTHIFIGYALMAC
jgi:hypothetical protein